MLEMVNFRLAVKIRIACYSGGGSRVALDPCPQTDDSPIGQIRSCNQEGD